MDRRSGDSLRLLATLAVLCIHAAGSFEHGLVEGGAGGWQAYLAATVSQLSRFSVPVFMILSGYGLAASRLRRDEGGLAGAVAMWRRQFLRIGLPYLVFTVGGLIFLKRFDSGAPGTWPLTLLARSRRRKWTAARQQILRRKLLLRKKKLPKKKPSPNQ